MAPKKIVVAPRNKVRKSASRPRSVDTDDERTDDEQIVRVSNEEARHHGIDNSEPPKLHAKVLSMQISVGSEDRNYTIEQFEEWVREALGAVPFGKDGVHATVMSKHYILDGKVCLPQDYDPKKGNFADGAIPPEWAGGPKIKKLVTDNIPRVSMGQGMSKETYDAKYGPGGSPQARALLDHQKEVQRDLRQQKEDKKLAEIPIEWDEGDIGDEEMHEKTSKRSIKIAARKLSGAAATKKKVVVKRAASASPPLKRVVRRKK